MMISTSRQLAWVSFLLGLVNLSLTRTLVPRFTFWFFTERCHVQDPVEIRSSPVYWIAGSIVPLMSLVFLEILATRSPLLSQKKGSALFTAIDFARGISVGYVLMDIIFEFLSSYTKNSSFAAYKVAIIQWKAFVSIVITWGFIRAPVIDNTESNNVRQRQAQDRDNGLLETVVSFRQGADVLRQPLIETTPV